MPAGALPLAECLADVVARLLPYWEEAIAPDLRAGRTVLVGAHGYSLRALVKHLDAISDADIVCGWIRESVSNRCGRAASGTNATPPPLPRRWR